MRFPLGMHDRDHGRLGIRQVHPARRHPLPALANRVARTRLAEGAYRVARGRRRHVDKVINIDQSPIGRTPRSNPATYVGLFGPIRELFARLPEAQGHGLHVRDGSPST